MIGVAKVISTSLDRAKRSVVKILFQGKLTNGQGDVRTPIEASAFGVDSNPTEGKIAIYAQSPQKGKYYIIGYLNTDRKALVGETRLFSTDDAGALQAYLWLRNNGQFLELNGNDNFAVKFNELKTEFNELKGKHNDLVSKYNALAVLMGTHVHPYINVAIPATTSASGTPGQAATPSAANIDNAKNTKIKTNS